MSVERAKRKIQQLERKRGKLALRATRLAAEQEKILQHSRAVDLLVQHQHNIARFPTLEEDTGLVQATFYQWPLMQQLHDMQLAKYAWVHSQHTTLAQVCDTCVQHMQQIALLLSYHKNNPDDANPLLDVAVSDFVQLTKAIYLLNPRLAWGMKDINLITLRHEPPPDEHWQRAFLAADHTLEQLQQMQQVMRYVVPRMEQLEAERQQLTDAISSMKGLSLHEQTVLQKAVLKEQQQQQQQAEEPPEQLPPAATRAPNRRAPGMVIPLKKSSRLPGQTPTAAAGACARQQCSATTTVALQCHTFDVKPAAPATFTAAAAMPAAGSSDSSSSSSGSSGWQGPGYPKLCKDMVNELDSKLHKWRMLSGVRSAMTYVSTSAQLAALLVNSLPYLPMASCLCDYIELALERQLQQQKQLLQNIKQEEEQLQPTK